MVALHPLLYSRGVGIGAASSQTIAGSAEGALGHLQDQFLFEAVLGEAPSVAEPKSTLREDSPNKATISGKRSGIKQQTAYLALPVYEQVRRLAFEENTKMHTLLMGGPRSGIQGPWTPVDSRTNGQEALISA